MFPLGSRVSFNLPRTCRLKDWMCYIAPHVRVHGVLRWTGCDTDTEHHEILTEDE